jgi:hypothetical protein
LIAEATASELMMSALGEIFAEVEATRLAVVDRLGRSTSSVALIDIIPQRRS